MSSNFRACLRTALAVSAVLFVLSWPAPSNAGKSPNASSDGGGSGTKSSDQGRIPFPKPSSHDGNWILYHGKSFEGKMTGAGVRRQRVCRLSCEERLHGMPRHAGPERPHEHLADTGPRLRGRREQREMRDVPQTGLLRPLPRRNGASKPPRKLDRYALHVVPLRTQSATRGQLRSVPSRCRAHVGAAPHKPGIGLRAMPSLIVFLRWRDT